jgi:DNA-binding LytR/AlgR family response regulator
LKLKATFSNAIQAMDFLKTEEIDLIFLDIHLPKISGIDFLKSLSNPPSIILTTAFSEYALESYEFNVVDYLLKPFSFQRFVKAISKMPTKNIGQVSEKLENSKKEIFIKSGYEHIKVIIDNIFYIKSDADYTEIFLADKKHLSSEPLRYWLENLDNNQFIRIHKSYIINTFKIEKVASNQVFLNEKMIIPIGRAFKESFAERFLK